ncbi:hypothetical protein A2291_04210 [candidate division WOR-1 bacterium RIFOXYB2_FULL_42_35]|uniref:Glycosyltransferase RgtA/B/C/D-like domain-containing protein n=1 Tax=candidate division WOR-1 bacterium RIFOXYC2_FULL_41_25 TaxID=1802586 RepID=A0A1F4TN54_UNCSA|nr:MAG: hypothetical protein A2247_01050 [candidate division WOR-1 bacterium RIFOXYA2_FULL_41_14]OGC24335.1 MAG: hypothetical protein A2291_04210 [candidate division WOR-1 bacterium RIFOXYB2_FULL_42_35]OGC34037.1 MAG: hypothetical protein A2462_01615 [candidate division WOR-1 bacterium RIFOXYC2_FULL_41_25]OGC42351.1 MAG: hypothetical protein A2548_07325 [candidate division WOR-1 bacterium RIFOXYD2_FULL_41_8]
MNIKDQISKIKNRELIVLIVLAFILFFFRLGDFSLYDAVESTYGEFIKQMRLTGNWLTLHYNDQIIFDKPPLYYWVATFLSYLFGLNELTIRLFAAVCGVSTVVVTYLFGKTFYNRRTGFFAGLIVMTALQFIVQSRIAELDIVLTLFMTSALLFFYLARNSEHKQLYLLTYVAMALATLTKGIIGAAVPAFTIFLFLIIKREFYRFKEMKLMLGTLIFLLIALPWYLLNYLVHGQVFAEFVLGFLFLSRFEGAVSGHAGPWYYYFIMIPLGFAPWSQFLPLSLFRTWKSSRNPAELLMLCHILPLFIVFSIAKTKLPGYVLPLYPFLAITIAKLWDDFLGAKQKELRLGMTIAQIGFSLVVGLIVIALIILGRNYPGYYEQLSVNILTLEAILVVGGLTSFILYFSKKYLWSFFLYAVISFAIIASLVFQTLPVVEGYKATKDLAKKVSTVLQAEDQIAAWEVGNRPSVVYYNKKTVRFLLTKADLYEFVRSKKGYCFVTKEQFNNLTTKLPVFTKQGELIVLH